MKRQQDKVITIEHVNQLYEDLCRIKTEYQKILDSRSAVIKLLIKSDNTMKQIDELLADARSIIKSAKKKRGDEDEIKALNSQFNQLLKLAEAEITGALMSMRQQNAKLELTDLIFLLNQHPHEYHYLRMIGLLLQKYYDEKSLLIEITECDHDKHHARPHITGLHYQKFE